jgi:hypothetical protein
MEDVNHSSDGKHLLIIYFSDGSQLFGSSLPLVKASVVEEARNIITWMGAVLETALKDTNFDL